MRFAHLLLVIIVASDLAGCAGESGIQIAEGPPDLPRTPGAIEKKTEGTYHEMVAAASSGIVVATPRYSDGDRVVPAELQIWHGTGNRATLLTTLPDMLIAIATLGDTVFAFTTSDAGSANGLGMNTRVHRVDVQTGTMRTDRAASDERVNMRLTSDTRTIVRDGLIYLVGGCCQSPTVYAYDPVALRFEKIAEVPRTENPHGTDRIRMGLEWFGNELLVAPGGRSDSGPSRVIHAYDIVTRTWRVFATLDRDWGASDLAVYDGTLWFIASICFLRYEAESGRFVGDAMHYPGAFFDAVEWNGEMYLLSLGGEVHRWTPPQPAHSWIANPTSWCVDSSKT